MWNFYTILLQVHSGNCLQNICLLDLSLIKLLQNEQGANFFASQCILNVLFYLKNTRTTVTGRRSENIMTID